MATGRGYVIEPGSFIGLYCVYAKSHMYSGFEVMCNLLFYHFYAETASWMAVWTLWFYAGAMMLAPYLFNPQVCHAPTHPHAPTPMITHARD